MTAPFKACPALTSLTSALFAPRVECEGGGQMRSGCSSAICPALGRTTLARIMSSQLMMSIVLYTPLIVIQTEASRRRREAEVQQAMENGLGSCMYVCMYVCMYICMFFTYISQFTAHTEFKSVPFARPLNATLLRNEFSWVRYPTSAWHVKIAKKSTKIPE